MPRRPFAVSNETNMTQQSQPPEKTFVKLSAQGTQTSDHVKTANQLMPVSGTMQWPASAEIQKRGRSTGRTVRWLGLLQS